MEGSIPRRSFTRVKTDQAAVSTTAGKNSSSGGLASSSSKRGSKIKDEDLDLQELDELASESEDLESEESEEKRGSKGGKKKEETGKGVSKNGKKQAKEEPAKGKKNSKGAKIEKEKPEKGAKGAKNEKPEAKDAKGKGKAKGKEEKAPAEAAGPAKAKLKDAKKGKLDEEDSSLPQGKPSEPANADEELEEEVMPDDDDGEEDDAPIEIDGAKGEILRYMRSTNRPYSFINIMDNTRGAYKKKQLEKILDDLEADGQLIGKLYGKAKIYYYNQRLFPQVDEDKLLAMGTEMKELEDGLKAKKENLKSMHAEAKRLDKVQTTQEMNEEIEALKKKLGDMDVELTKYKTEVKLVDDKDLQVLEKGRDKMQQECRRRNKILKDVLDMVAESLEIKVHEARVKLGID